MDALRREHELGMAATEAQAPALADRREANHLREWNLSALDAIKTQQNLDRLNERKAVVAARAREARTDEVPLQLVDSSPIRCHSFR